MIVRTRRSTFPTLPKRRGLTVAEHPNTRKILKMLLPITLPSAIAVFPLRAAVTDVASSGREVPIATIVRPITASLTPMAEAIPDAPSTNKSPPKIRPASPPTIQMIDFSKGISLTGDLSTSSSDSLRVGFLAALKV